MKISLLITFCILSVSMYFNPAKADVKNGKTSFTINESANYYELSATYNKELTRKVQNYMDDCLDTKFSFTNAQLDADMSFDNKISFYIKAFPGTLVLKFDKRKNTSAAYSKFKKMSEGLKDVINDK